MRALITAKTTPTSIRTGAEVQAIAKSHFAASSGSSHAVPLRPSEQLFFKLLDKLPLFIWVGFCMDKWIFCDI